MNVTIHTLVSDICQENGYILHDSDIAECVVIDPGFSVRELLQLLSEKGLTPVAVLLTHGHADHVGGLPGLKKAFPDVEIVIGSGDTEKLASPKKNFSEMFGFGLRFPDATREITEETETLTYAGLRFTARHTPGHSAGHYVFILEDTTPRRVFAGDLIFRESVGRTDFYDGDVDQLRDSIQTSIYTLPDETVLLPGHDASTTVGHEAAHNPFVRPASGGTR